MTKPKFKYPYKVMENNWGEIFIIKAGLRQVRLGTFNTVSDAQKKCDELNGVSNGKD